MKPENKKIKDLDEKSRNYIIKVKVIDKTYTQVSPRKTSLKYKRITFADEEGSRIKCTLYNDDIDAFDQALKEEMEYEISNAKVKPVPDPYKTPGDRPFQLSFNNRTIIRHIPGTSVPSGPKYQSLATIQKTVDENDRFDVLAVVLYVEDAREIQRQSGQKLRVREVVVTDHSTEQPITISTWETLAITEGESLHEIQATFPIIGFTNLRTSYHKGFTLTATSSSTIIVHPEDEKTRALVKWKRDHSALLFVRQDMVNTVRQQDATFKATTLHQLRSKKVSNTLQEERHWLKVTAPEFDRKDVRFYLGCSNCNSSSNEDISTIFDCKKCKENGVISVARMNISFEATDDTGSYTFTAFTDDAQKLLGKEAHDLYAMSDEDQLQYLSDIEQKVRNEPFYVQTGPSIQLARSQVLKWVLKSISISQPNQEEFKAYDQFEGSFWE